MNKFSLVEGRKKTSCDMFNYDLVMCILVAISDTLMLLLFKEINAKLISICCNLISVTSQLHMPN